MEKPDFGTRLIEVRKAKGLTQDEVAEKCKISVRTIQRIESGLVTPRAFTIKIISEKLGFDFFGTLETAHEPVSKNKFPNPENHSFLWKMKDLFNLKTKAMKKISILSGSTLLVVLLFTGILNLKAQPDIVKAPKSLIIQLSEAGKVERVEAVFTRNLTLDSLVQIKRDLQSIGITIHYRKIEFDVHNLLLNISCEVICNDGYSGSFETGDLSMRKRDDRIGFYRDYTPDCASPFGTGGIR